MKDFIRYSRQRFIEILNYTIFDLELWDNLFNKWYS